MNLLHKGQFLVIEGNIGAGKTSLAQRLAADFQAGLTLEAFADNPFLPLFYQQPERYAFNVELFFMTERHRQMETWLLEAKNNQFKYKISDYLFFKTLLFARENLHGEEWRLFEKIFNTMNASFPQPDLLVYLHRPVPDLLRQIGRRGRAYEGGIRPEYLERIQQAYFQFFQAKGLPYPVVLLDLGSRDFVHSEADYRWVLDKISGVYASGLHIIRDENAEYYASAPSRLF